ncbi:metallophosphoesterase [Candidatus Pacearchaeota archaeon]|nr:metallophosphoesterase [Candidatus Pacearchaeota archaeon]
MEKKLKILAAGDLHGNLSIAKKLSKKGEREEVDLVILAGDIYGYKGGNKNILEPFTKAKQKVIFIPGNCDFNTDAASLIKRAKCIHNKYVTYGDVGIAGIGSPNWTLNLNEDDFSRIEKNLKKMKMGKQILVSHLHASGTKAEFSGIPGDIIIEKAVRLFEPDLLISAHIHEAEGLEDIIGNTKVIQVGSNGIIIEI